MYNKNISIICIVMFLYIACASTGISVAASSDDGADSIAKQLTPILKELSHTKVITVAIIPFGGPKGRPTHFGMRMAELLQMRLMSQSWILVERERINSVIEEQSLKKSGLVDNDYLNTGNITGADYIITGTTYYGKKALISVKIINVKTSVVEGIAQVHLIFDKR